MTAGLELAYVLATCRETPSGVSVGRAVSFGRTGQSGLNALNNVNSEPGWARAAHPDDCCAGRRGMAEVRPGGGAGPGARTFMSGELAVESCRRLVAGLELRRLRITEG
jgi:hypothetical protein